MSDEIRFFCPYCGEENITDIYISAGNTQEFIHDCEVCCRPVEIKLTFDRDGNVNLEIRNDEGF